MVVNLLRHHVGTDAVAINGCIGIHWLALDTENKRRFVAAGAPAVLQSILADPHTSAEAKRRAEGGLRVLA